MPFRIEETAKQGKRPKHRKWGYSEQFADVATPIMTNYLDIKVYGRTHLCVRLFNLKIVGYSGVVVCARR